MEKIIAVGRAKIMLQYFHELIAEQKTKEGKRRIQHMHDVFMAFFNDYLKEKQWSINDLIKADEAIREEYTDRTH